MERNDWSASPKYASLDAAGVHAWLEKNQAKSRYDTGREEFEAALMARDDRTINLGLALFTQETDTAMGLLQSEDTLVRRAVLNSFDFEHGFGTSVFNEVLKEVITPGESEDLLSAYLANSNCKDEDLTALFKRKEPFDEWSDEAWHGAIWMACENDRLSEEYDSSHMDGMAEYMHNEVATSGWELFATLPVADKCATILSYLSNKLAIHAPRKMDIGQTIERWQSDSELMYYEDCRTKLTQLFPLSSDEFKALSQSEDVALRNGYYHRFRPRDPGEIRAACDRDGPVFIDEGMYNENLLRNPGMREEFRKCCWDCAKDHDRSDLFRPSRLNSRLDHYRKEHPDWFDVDELSEVETEDPVDAIRQQIGGLTRRVEEVLQAQAGRSSASGSVIAALVVGFLLGLILG